jgi:hypothetical protein
MANGTMLRSSQTFNLHTYFASFAVRRLLRAWQE